MARETKLTENQNLIKETKTLDEVEEINVHKKQREDKRDDKLTEDLMYGKDAYKRTVRDTQQERDRRYARLHSFGGQSNVTIGWDLNAESIRDQVFMLKVGDQTTYLSAIEFQKYLRWV